MYTIAMVEFNPQARKSIDILGSPTVLGIGGACRVAQPDTDIDIVVASKGSDVLPCVLELAHVIPLGFK
jgi:hypothetical protein